MDRRNFLRNSSKAAIAPLLPRLFASSAFAESTSSDYKAVVCLYLFGGNDGNNMLVPMDDYYQQYTVGRGAITLSRNSLLPLAGSTSGRLFGLHPALTNLTSLYNQGHAALVANAGPLTTPLTKATIAQGAATPQDLFGHTSQLAEWQSAITRTSSSTGWAGRIADVLSAQSQTTALPTVVSTAGWSLLGAGAKTSAVATSGGSSTIQVLNALSTLGPVISRLEQGDPLNHLHDLISQRQSGFMGQANVLAQVFQAGSGIRTVFPQTSIGQQLQTVAQIIHGRSQSGTSKQIFFCQDANLYDTHAKQLDGQMSNLLDIDAALGAFMAAMTEIGMFDNVTLFSMTDFARAKQVNSTAGTDHAWGNHHFVAGGAVRGGKIYGTFPSLVMGGDDDAGTTGLWIPTTSGSQYAATLAQWLGVGPSDLGSIFPELGNFSTQTLNFV
jgi:uncharacterized protein (DUF1501 family)